MYSCWSGVHWSHNHRQFPRSIYIFWEISLPYDVWVRLEYTQIRCPDFIMSLDGLTGIYVEYSGVLFMLKLLKLDFFNSQPYDKWQYVLRSIRRLPGLVGDIFYGVRCSYPHASLGFAKSYDSNYYQVQNVHSCYESLNFILILSLLILSAFMRWSVAYRHPLNFSFLILRLCTGTLPRISHTVFKVLWDGKLFSLLNLLKNYLFVASKVHSDHGCG